MVMAIVLIVTASFSQYIHVAANSQRNRGEYQLKSFSAGSGTASDPYQIATAEELAYLVNQVATEGWTATCFDSLYYKPKYYQITADINLNDVAKSNWKNKNPKEWTYGTAADISTYAFLGNIEGNGHVIRGLYINKSASSYNGLFAGVMGNCRISNLGIEDSYINGKSVEGSYSGAFFGGQHDWPFDTPLELSGCYVNDSVAIEGNNAGGFGGRANSNAIITNSYSNAKVMGEVKGNFIGTCANTTISMTFDRCYSIQKDISFVGNIFDTELLTYDFCYSTYESGKGLAKYDISKMSGNNAKTYMSMFDFQKIWSVNKSGGPILKIFTDSFDENIDYEIWDGTVSSELSLKDPSKANSEENPYIIKNGADLAFLVSITDGSQTRGKFYELACDIYLNNVSMGWKTNNPREWTYGSRNDSHLFEINTHGAFYGSLNGKGHVIRGIYIKSSANRVSGLFPAIGDSAIIKNLGIEESFISAYSQVSAAETYAGAFAGYHARSGNGSWSKTVISNCYVDDTVIVSSTYAGGIFGLVLTTSASPVEINDCFATCTLDWSRKGGGIIADIWENTNPVTLTRCYNNQEGVSLSENNGNGCITFVDCYTAGTGTGGVTKVDTINMIGADSLYYMSALFKNGTVWYKTKSTPRLSVFRSSSIDSEPPVFNGNIVNIDSSKTTIGISWPVATDGINPSEFLAYSVYYSEEPITVENITEAIFYEEYIAINEAFISGLSVNEDYYFAVKVTDPYDNMTLLSAGPFTTKIKVNAVWNGATNKYFDSGDGTKENPYQISSAEQLAYLAKLSNGSEAYLTSGKHYILTSDIYLNDVSVDNWNKKKAREWSCGKSYNPSVGFCGNLDGQYHVINGIYIGDGTATYCGLFSTLGDGATISNLGIANSYIIAKKDENGGGYAGAIAGYKVNGATSQSNISQCFSDNTVTVVGKYVGGLVGGIAWPINGGSVTFTDCYSGAEISGTVQEGGIVGDIWDEVNAKFVRCYSTQTYTPMLDNNNWYATYEDCYAFEKTKRNKTGITTIPNRIQLIGNNAKKNMPNFDYEKVWSTVEFGTPYLRGFKTNRYTIENEVVTITFETNGGNVINPISGLAGTKFAKLPTPTREGNRFVGWYVYSELDVKYPIDTFPGYSLTLFAKWEDSAVIRQNFESYSFRYAGMEGLGDGYELYRPGVRGYDTKFVHKGMRSIHRLADSTEHGEQNFVVFNSDSNTLEKGKKYKMTMWIYLESGQDGEISAVATDSLEVKDTPIGIQKMISISKLKTGTWQQLSVEFTALGKYIAIRTPGGTSIYFDDVDIIPTIAN